MGAIALALCLAFSGILIVRDMKRSTSLSVAVWIPTIFLMILASRPLSMWLGAPLQYGALGGNNVQRNRVDELFFLVVLSSSWVIATLRGVKWGKLFTSNSALMMLYLFFAVSVLWSTDPIGSTTRLCKDFALLFVIAVVMTEEDPFAALQAIYYRCAAVLLPLSLVFIRYYGNLGRAYSMAGFPELTGVTTQKNSLGETVLVFSLFLIWDWMDPHPKRTTGEKKNKIPWDTVVLLGLGAWLLQLSQSKSALVCILVGVTVMLKIGRSPSKLFSRLVFVGALCAPLALLFTQAFASIIAPFVQALGRDMTFTGRTIIWERINSTTVNPIIGSGYWNFWGGPGGTAISRAIGAVIPNAHCGYLDIYIDGGWFGLLFLYLVFFVCGNRILKHLHDDRFQAVRFAILVASIIYNLSESMFLRMSPLWFTTLLALVEFPSKQVAPAPPEPPPTKTFKRRPVAEPKEKKQYQSVTARLR